MLSMYAREFKCITVVFTSTPSIIQYAISLGHTVVTHTKYLCIGIIIFRTNRYGLPFIQPILEISKVLYKSRYYGYLNSDILFSSRVFQFMESTKKAIPPLADVVEFR